MHGHGTSTLSLIVALLPCLLCCAPELPVVDVSVGGDMQGVNSLSVVSSLLAAGQDLPYAEAPLPVYSPLDHFVVELPTGFRGQVLIQVQGLDSAQCQVAAGEVRITVPGPGNEQASVTLQHSDPGGCRVAVQLFPPGVPGRILSDREFGQVDRSLRTFQLNCSPDPTH